MIEIKGKLTEPLFIDTKGMIIALIIALAVPIAFYILRTIGVYTLAKKANLKTAFLAFFPGLWVYPFTKLVKEVKFFKSTLGKWALVFTILTTLTIALSFIYQFLIYFPLAGNLLEGRTIYIALDADMASYFESNMGYVAYPALSGVYVNVQNTATNGAFVYPYQFVFIDKWLNLISIVSETVGLFVTVIEIILFFNVFRKYWPQHFVLATILSIFGAFPIFAFIIRKKQPINYFEFLRNRYQNTYGPYGTYGPQDPRMQYGNPNVNSHTNAQSNPFQDFESNQNKPEEPFAEFNSNDKKDDN